MLDGMIANLRFWYSKKTIKVNVHYEFMLDMCNTDAMTIRILKKFPKVIAEYSNIHMSSDTQMTYDFNVIANPNLCNVESERFKNLSSHSGHVWLRPNDSGANNIITSGTDSPKK